MKFISWNVNGLRACIGKGFMDFFNAEDADFFCLQETKLQAGQIQLEPEGYQSFWNFIESIFERINMIFEYFAEIFNW